MAKKLRVPVVSAKVQLRAPANPSASNAAATAAIKTVKVAKSVVDHVEEWEKAMGFDSGRDRRAGGVKTWITQDGEVIGLDWVESGRRQTSVKKRSSVAPVVFVSPLGEGVAKLPPATVKKWVQSVKKEFGLQLRQAPTETCTLTRELPWPWGSGTRADDCLD